MTNPIVVFGFGATGRATTLALLAQGKPVCVAQRHRPADLPPQASFRPCDILDADAVRQAVDGASQVVLAIGFQYDARVWRVAWPRAIHNVVEACAATGARVVFVDNLYMLGAQDEPLREDMALTAMGAKPPIRAEVTRIWQAAAAAGRVRFAALRAPDFYGPGVALSHLGPVAFGRLAQGKAAILMVPPDMPHDFAYVPDMARAVVTLLDAPDDAYGQVWNMPCAPTRTARDILRLGAQALGVKPKVWALPQALVPVLSLVSPLMREVADIGFTWDRPYRVDASKFTRRFWSDVTPFETGAPAAALSFRPPVGQAGQVNSRLGGSPPIQASA